MAAKSLVFVLLVACCSRLFRPEVSAVSTRTRLGCSRGAHCTRRFVVLTTLGGVVLPAQAAIPIPEKNEQELRDSLVLIYRVIEGTQQEERLINTGKYKDLQRYALLHPGGAPCLHLALLPATATESP